MYLALKRCPLLTVPAMLAGIAFGWSIQAAPTEDRFPTSTAFTLDLHSYGWEVPEGQHEVNTPSIVVDHVGRVVLGFTVRARKGLVTRGQPSLDFRIMRFSPGGQLDLTLLLPTHVNGINAIYLSDTDQIIARANDSLQLLQADYGNPQKEAWKTLCAQSCRVLQSPTRRTLILQAKNVDPPLTIVRFSPQLTLRRCGNSPEDRFQTYAQYVTDEFAYYHGWEAESDYFTYRWPLCEYEHRVAKPLGAGGRWTVLNDDSFVMFPHSKRRKDEELVVVSSDGQVRLRPAMQEHELVGRTSIKSSELGNVIAVDLLTVRGRSGALDLSGHVTDRRIAVYNIDAGKELASIPVNPRPHYHFEFGLSPDGHRVAILEDDKVRVVDVEAAEKAQ